MFGLSVNNALNEALLNFFKPKHFNNFDCIGKGGTMLRIRLKTQTALLFLINMIYQLYIDYFSYTYFISNIQ